MTLPTAEEVAGWRLAIGESAGVWARHGVESNAHGWVALSGAPVPDYNVIAVHDAGGEEHLGAALEQLRALRCPGLVMLGGSGLRLAATLADMAWVCVTATPLMALRASDATAPVADAEGCGPLAAADRPAALRVIADAFELPEEVAPWALPTDAHDLTRDVAGLHVDGELVSLGAAPVTSRGVAVAWSMATPAARQRRGHSGRLLRWMITRSFAGGADSFALLASPPGIPGYLGAGFRTVEHWQVWSRPRWVMGA